jgi:hypothetical protein
MTQYPTLYNREGDDEDELENAIDTNTDKEKSKENIDAAVINSESSPS